MQIKTKSVSGLHTFISFIQIFFVNILSNINDLLWAAVTTKNTKHVK